PRPGHSAAAPSPDCGGQSMHSPEAMHLSDERLQRFADGELDGPESNVVERHLAACAECRNTLDSIGRAAASYLEYHREMLKGRDPAPPRAWADLRSRLDQMEARSDAARRHPRARQWRD